MSINLHEKGEKRIKTQAPQMVKEKANLTSQDLGVPKCIITAVFYRKSKIPLIMH